MAFLRKRGKNYAVVFIYRGKRYEKACKTSQRPVAEAIRRTIESQVASKTFKIENIEQQAQKTIGEFTEEYLSYSRTTKSRKTVELDMLSLRKLRTFAGNIPLDSITAQRMEQFKSTLAKEYSATTINMTLRSLSAAFAKAIVWKYLDENPLKKVEQIRIAEEDGPFLTREDIGKLRGVMPAGLYRDFIETALYTGMRVSEICNLKWNDIDFVAMKIRVKNTESFSTKSKKERTVPLHPNLSEILGLRSRVDHLPFVFIRDDGKQVDRSTANDKFREYCMTAGLDPKFHFHSLRHTFASHLAMKGVSLYFIQKILGHASIETTTRTYAHLMPDPLVHAVKELDY